LAEHLKDTDLVVVFWDVKTMATFLTVVDKIIDLAKTLAL
jgi:hypothetical protein